MTVSIDSFIVTLEVILLYALLEPANGKNVSISLGIVRHCTFAGKQTMTAGITGHAASQMRSPCDWQSLKQATICDVQLSPDMCGEEIVRTLWCCYLMCWCCVNEVPLTCPRLPAMGGTALHWRIQLPHVAPLLPYGVWQKPAHMPLHGTTACWPSCYPDSYL